MFGKSKPKAPQSMAELQTQFTANAEAIMQEQDKLQSEAEARIAELEIKKAKEQEKVEAHSTESRKAQKFIKNVTKFFE